MMLLIIKGSRNEAIQALNQHDIPILSDGKEYNSANEFHVNCHIVHKEKVKEWFNESTGRLNRWASGASLAEPFRPGDLLFFSETELAVLI